MSVTSSLLNVVESVLSVWTVTVVDERVYIFGGTYYYWNSSLGITGAY
jgi:hypothetical protein